MTTIYTPNEAYQELLEMAENATDENYHSEASILYKAADRAHDIRDRTLLLVPTMYGDIAEFGIVPDKPA